MTQLYMVDFSENQIIAKLSPAPAAVKFNWAEISFIVNVTPTNPPNHPPMIVVSAAEFED